MVRRAADRFKEGEDRGKQIKKAVVSHDEREVPRFFLSSDGFVPSSEEMAALAGQAKETEATANGVDEDVVMQDSSDLSEVSGSEGENDTPRQKETRRTAAKERELARAKSASAKQALAERRRLDEEVNKLERRLEGIEREFRKLFGAVRVKPLGKDRFYNRIWWFDGMGSASLIGSGGIVQYGTGRIFVQGPSEFDVDVLERREEDVATRRREEEGVEGMLGVGEWAVYNDLEEVRHDTTAHSDTLLMTVIFSDRRTCCLAKPQRSSRTCSQECIYEVVASHRTWCSAADSGMFRSTICILHHLIEVYAGPGF